MRRAMNPPVSAPWMVWGLFRPDRCPAWAVPARWRQARDAAKAAGLPLGRHPLPLQVEGETGMIHREKGEGTALVPLRWRLDFGYGGALLLGASRTSQDQLRPVPLEWTVYPAWPHPPAHFDDAGEALALLTKAARISPPHPGEPRSPQEMLAKAVQHHQQRNTPSPSEG